MVLVGLDALTIQTTFCATHRIDDVTPNLMLAMAISSGIVAGPEAGAYFYIVWIIATTLLADRRKS